MGWTDARVVPVPVREPGLTGSPVGLGSGKIGRMRLFRRPNRDPAWGLEAGDVLAFAVSGQEVVRVQVVESEPPNKEYDYRRVIARVVEPPGLDVRGKEGNDSVVPVGNTARPVEITGTRGDLARGLRDAFAATLGPGEGGLMGPLPTPGLVVLVPEGDGSADEPLRAGFHVVDRAVPQLPADGFAVLMDWPTFAGRLRGESSPDPD